ncbi:MAG: GDP-mannose 4,6-dehydratase [Desulfobulbaceae bacterium]|nr:MAG: GDP-mannose 4,6-dehydratase [Desulfobulbaceae bacterium]
MSKNALITGITGQDGSYLTELLLSKGYHVHGIVRVSTNNRNNPNYLLLEKLRKRGEKIHLHSGDLSDSSRLTTLISAISPDEIYNLAAQSNVSFSFAEPKYTSDINAIGTLRILEAIRNLKFTSQTKLYHASTSELFGKAQESPQTETTPFYPRSPYAIAKLYSYWTVINYREAYDIFACNGILFNHESPRRGETFVTRKVTKALARIYFGLQDCLYLGNLNAKRDWGHARDYVEMQWLMLQQKFPDDYVIATGVQHSVRSFVEIAASELGLTIGWHGKDQTEVGIIEQIDSSLAQKCKIKPGQTIIRVDPQYYRPAEVENLLGNSQKAKNNLGWTPKTSFKNLVKEMIAHDLDQTRKDLLCKENGYET